MIWTFKKQLVQFNFENFKSHVQLPILKQDYIYFSSRDSYGKSHINRIKNNNFETILSPKENFDFLGCMPSCFINDFLFYTGWQPGEPYIQNICLYNDGKRFKILSPDQDDSFLVNSPCILKINEIYKMWYVSCVGWVKNKPIYNINYAESDNLFKWKIIEKNCLKKFSEFESPSRPCVNYIEGFYYMYFSSIDLEKDHNYRLYYACSKNGIEWERRNIIIDYNQQTMLCYPWVENNLMLINGNEYGKNSIFLYEK